MRLSGDRWSSGPFPAWIRLQLAQRQKTKLLEPDYRLRYCATSSNSERLAGDRGGERERALTSVMTRGVR